MWSVELCGCYDITLPREASMSNAIPFCQQIPPIFRRARHFAVDFKHRNLTLLDSRESVIDVVSFSESPLKELSCIQIFRKVRSVRKSTDCPVPCHKVSGGMFDSFNLDIDDETEWPMHKSGLKLKDYSLVRIAPSDWLIPVTIREEIYPLSKLISDIGGMLGMWLGASSWVRSLLV